MPETEVTYPGGRDGFTPVSEFLRFCQELTEPEECHTIEEADHFWWGHEKEMAAKVATFLKIALNE